MIKLILLGLGIMLLVEGSLYGLFPKKMKKMMEIMQNYDDQKIRNAAIPLCIIGFCPKYSISSL